jgi:CubicO group peptidase (beta-lactamase class C family)
VRDAAEVLMTLNAQNLVAWHDRSTADHVAQRDTFAAQGFRPLSLSIYGSTSDPRYAAVMVKRPVVIATHSFVGLSQAGYQNAFDDMASQGFGPFIITATGPGASAVFAGSFRQMSHIPLTRSNLSKDQFIDLNRAQHDAGAMLLWADVFGTPADPRYCAIWVANPERIAWNIDAVDEGGAALQQRFEAMAGTLARPAIIAVTPAARIMELYVDSQIGPWASRAGMTSADYQTEFNTQANAGLWPVCVSASGEGSNARFAAIFATREEHLPRVFRSTGSAAVASIDAALQKYVTDQNLRGAALAIVSGTRLVYARGYTFAEASPAYHDIQPATPFRQASISKTFCAVAVWKLIEQGQLTLDTTLQSVLNLKQPNGTAPKDSRFGDIKIKHLLQSISGVNQGGVWNAVAASQAAGGTLPSDGIEVARWITTLDLTGTPGDKNNAVYGNTDYFLLSLVVARKLGAASFEAALASLVLNPLGLKHTRGSRSLAGAQVSDEARYHLTVHNPENGWPLVQLETAASVRSQAQPVVASHYGSYDYEMFDGCGGLSSAVIDVARLCAMFSCRSNNPVLAATTIDQMLAAAVNATNTQKGPDGKGSHGYDGFDWAANVNVANHEIQFSKGGWLPGQGTSYVGTTGGLFYVLAQNGNSRQDVTTKWLDPIQPIAESHDWGTGDLFPSFGMASLPVPLTLTKIAPVAFKIGPEATQEMVVRSLVRTVPRIVRRT